MYRLSNISKFVVFGCLLLPSMLPAQIFEDCQQVVPPFSWGGIDVDHIMVDNVDFMPLNQPVLELCLGSGYFVPLPRLHLGNHPGIGPCGVNPFVYQLVFSKPIVSMSFMILIGVDEDFVFESECADINLTPYLTCNAEIYGDSIVLNGSGWFRISFDKPVNSFSIRGGGEGCGSDFKICANSLNQAPLWAGVHGSEVVCGSGSLSFERYGWLVGPYTYTYNINGGAPQTYVTNETLAEIPLAELFGYEPEPGQYTIELTEIMDGSGWPVALSCNTSHTFEVAQKPMAQFTATPTTGFVPLQVTTQNQSSNATEYEWLIGGFGSAQPPAVQPLTSVAENPVFTFQDTGVYEITLIASNALGCADTARQTIHVLEELQLVIPNVFTPNNDGINDWFGITANVSVPASVVILNRWGNVVFEKEFATEAGDFVEFWDGASTSSATTTGSVTTPSSVTVTDGVYFYRIALDGEGWSEEFTGFVTVKK